MHRREKEILIGYIVVPQCELKVKTHLRIINVNSNQCKQYTNIVIENK